MRILLLAHSFNSLTQRLWIELAAAGHELSVEFDVHDGVTEEAVALFRPDLVVAPFLKRRIPESVWRRHRCLVIHPGIRGDRGPSALDWAILDGATEWGVTVLEANGEMDAGDVWAERRFPMREAAKGSLYRNEVTEAAVAALAEALARIERGESPAPLDYADPSVRGRARPPMRQVDRAIDWRADDTTTVLRKIRAADGAPGVLDDVRGLRAYLYDAHRETAQRFAGAAPGDVVAQRHGAILRATIDGAVWITHLRRSEPGAFKLPAGRVLADRLAGVPELPLAPEAAADGETWRPIRYAERDGVGGEREVRASGAGVPLHRGDRQLPVGDEDLADQVVHRVDVPPRFLGRMLGVLDQIQVDPVRPVVGAAREHDDAGRPRARAAVGLA